MKKYASCFLVLTIVLGCLSACGKTSNEETSSNQVNDTIESQAEASNEVAVAATEETTTETLKQVEEQVTEPEGFVLTEEYAIEKLNKAYEGLGKALEVKKDAENVTIQGAENDWTFYEIETIATKDGVTMTSTADGDWTQFVNVWIGTYSKYFYNYINNDSGYYDFTEYISSNNYDDIALYSNTSDLENDDESAFNKFAMMGCRWLTSIFTNDDAKLTVDNITDVISVEHKDIFVNNDKNPVSAKYQCSIMINGEDSGLIVLFDENGNMLNINDENVNIEFKLTFPNGLQ